MERWATQLINSVEAQIGAEYLPECINWCDTHHNGAWSRAIDEFEKALVRGNATLAQHAGRMYLSTITGLIKKFKEQHNKSDEEMFLASLKKT